MSQVGTKASSSICPDIYALTQPTRALAGPDVLLPIHIAPLRTHGGELAHCHKLNSAAISRFSERLTRTMSRCTLDRENLALHDSGLDPAYCISAQLRSYSYESKPIYIHAVAVAMTRGLHP